MPVKINKTSLSGSAIYMEGTKIGYITNTIRFKLGTGEYKVAVIDEGDGSVSQQAVKDNASRKGALSCEIKSNIEDIKEYLVKQKEKQRDGSGLTVSLVTPDNQTILFSPFWIIGDPEINVSAEGNFQLQMEGAEARIM